MTHKTKILISTVFGVWNFKAETSVALGNLNYCVVPWRYNTKYNII